MSIFNPKNRVWDVHDPKWGHPECRDRWIGIAPGGPSSDPATSILEDPALSPEEKQERLDTLFRTFTTPSLTDYCDLTIYRDIPGCPLEPETPVSAYVYTPKDLDTDKANAMLYLCGGGMNVCIPEMFPLDEMCEKYQCVGVVPIYRTQVQGKYPAAVNDCHAVYQWMVQNAEMLRIDPDKIVLHGHSAGGTLATGLPFRLRPYGFSPRGVVSIVGITDDRSMYAGARLTNLTWDGPGLTAMCQRWLGDAHAAGRVPPEAFANRATVEECVGYPPLFLHAAEFDPDRDNSRDFVGKVAEAGSFTEFHMWGGVGHNLNSSPAAFCVRLRSLIDENVMDCFRYDLRRPWTEE